MSLSDTLTTVRYVTNAQGEKTDVLVPLTAWEALVASWKELIERLEDQEDKAILQDQLERRAGGESGAMSLDDLERELFADGLLPG